LLPVVDRGRCEAKADCVNVCPYQVFELRRVAPEDSARLGVVGRARVWVHGGRQAYVIDPARCHSCGQCVVACPEGAITLRPPAK
jgi:NAD-dependent dihydropyrimidine dehydrogenase PreA subunit